jgi:hypothetical protein
VRLRAGGATAHGAGIAWPSGAHWHARLHLWSGANELRGHWWLSSSAGSATRARWRGQADTPWRARVWPQPPALHFLPWVSAAPQSVPCVLRILLRASPAALAALERAVRDLPGLRRAPALSVARHLIAWADLPLACSPAAAQVRLQLAALLTDGRDAPWVRDPWARWTAWAEHQASDRAGLSAALAAHAADALIELQDLGAAARRAGLAGYAPRSAQPDGQRRYALVDACAALNDTTLAHELGHLIGAGHAPAYGVTSTLDALARAGAPIAPRGLANAAARGWHSPRLGVQTVMGGQGSDAEAGYQTLPLLSESGLDWLGRRTQRVGTRARGAAGVAEDALRWAQAAPGYRREVTPRG